MGALTAAWFAFLFAATSRLRLLLPDTAFSRLGGRLNEKLDPVISEIIRHKKPLVGVPEKEAAMIQLGREYFQTLKVSSETYARALQALGGEEPDRHVRAAGRLCRNFGAAERQ